MQAAQALAQTRQTAQVPRRLIMDWSPPTAEQKREGDTTLLTALEEEQVEAAVIDFTQICNSESPKVKTCRDHNDRSKICGFRYQVCGGGRRIVKKAIGSH